MKFKLLVLGLLVAFLLVDHGCGDGRTEASASGKIPPDLQANSRRVELLDNLTCAAREIAQSGLSPYSDTINTIVTTVRVVWYVPLIAVGSTLNFLVIYLVAKYKKLQTLSFGIALQIMVLNLLICVQSVTIVVTTLAGKWVFGAYVCIAIGYLSTALLLIRTGLMFVFVIDRFLSVFAPYFYPKHKTKIAISLSAFFWSVICVINILFLPGILDCYSFSYTYSTCISNRDCSNACSLAIGTYFLAVLPSTVIPLAMYVALYCKARSLRNAETAESAVGRSEEDSSRERRATVTFFLLFITLFAVTTPTTIFQAIVSRSTSPDTALPAALYIMQVICTEVLSIFVFTDAIAVMRHSDVREILSDMKTSLVQKWCHK